MRRPAVASAVTVTGPTRDDADAGVLPPKGIWKHSSRRDLVALALPAVVGTVALLVVTRKGVYASPDSAFYVGTARNLLDGNGLTAPPGSPPLSHFPPLFPLVLAAVGWLTGLDPLDAAGLVNALLLGATALTVALVVHRRSGSVALGVAGSVAVVVAVDLLVYFASALSEPLFAALVLGAMVSLAAAVETESRWAWLAAAVVTAGACLTRYVGVALVVAELAVLLRIGGRRAVAQASALAGLALAPLAVWLVIAGRGNRPVVVHLFDAGYWTGGARSLSRWVLPPFVPWPIRGVATALVVAALVWVALARRSQTGAAAERRSADVLSLLLAAFAVAYVVLLVADRVLLDATGRLDLRFLAVLHVAAIVGLLPWLNRHLAGRARPAAAGMGLALLALQGAYAGSWAAAGVADTDVGRRGLTATAWRDSPVLAAVAALAPEVPVYSNAPEAIFLLTGRTTMPLPTHTDYLSGRRPPSYETELAIMNDRLEAEDGVVVWFRPYAFRQRFVTGVAELDVATVLDDEVATLFRPRR